MRVRTLAGVVLSVGLFLLPGSAFAGSREARIPLRDGQLRLADLSRALSAELGLPACALGRGTVDLRPLRRTDGIVALNQAIGEGCRISVADDALVLHVDLDRLPGTCDRMSKAVRVFTAVVRPGALARQAASYGLLMPERFDPARPLVVLVHGLDNDRSNWGDMRGLLVRDGHQVASFNYPSDQSIADSAAFFTRKMTALRRAHPEARVDLLAHSMGGLVARAYVEGPEYAGGIERLIMVGTPNAGSKWARARLLLEAHEHYHLWRHDPDWSPSWMITDGLGEAGRDLKPGSAFLKELNARPRREGVKYTIIAGTQSPTRRVTANCLSRTANAIPRRVSGLWGVRHGKSIVVRAAERMREKVTGSDGPVSVKSTRLKGVDDFVPVQADHATLYFGSGNRPPGAWAAVSDRLRRQ